MTQFQIEKALAKRSNQQKAKILSRFFKTGPGQYGQGDVFLGVTVPQIRKLAKQYQNIPLNLTAKLLKSPIHEQRLLTLLILIIKFQKGNTTTKTKIYNLYLKNTRYIDNWDLVDLTAGHIVGCYLWDKNRAVLARLTRSKSLWERRIAIISTLYFIKNNQFKDTLNIARVLLNDPEDLIHKATGWMLREVGKRDLVEEERFLKKYSQNMPRTMLRYAIERFPEKKRKLYLLKKSKKGIK